mmetsp:Transcript_29700/g.74711  ORF Transcript_29700/g.74711 Transcript_29700/m.74711 type:complete len:207 (+) Transcript_29700:1839-2459(+)
MRAASAASSPPSVAPCSKASTHAPSPVTTSASRNESVTVDTPESERRAAADPVLLADEAGAGGSGAGPAFASRNSQSCAYFISPEYTSGGASGASARSRSRLGYVEIPNLFAMAVVEPSSPARRASPTARRPLRRSASDLSRSEVSSFAEIKIARNSLAAAGASARCAAPSAKYFASDFSSERLTTRLGARAETKSTRALAVRGPS